MTCEEAEKAFGGDLGAALADAEVAAHLSSCERCRAARMAFDRVDALLRTAPSLARTDRDRFLAALDARMDREAATARRVPRLWLRLAACLALAALACVLVRGVGGRHAPPPPPQAGLQAARPRVIASEPTLEELLGQLRSRSVLERRAALARIARRTDASSRSALCSAIDDPALSADAIALAGQTRCRDAVPRLSALARDPWNGAAAISALTSIGGRAVVPPLLCLLPEGPHAEEARAAIASLRRVALPLIRERLQTPVRAEFPALVSAAEAVHGVELLPWLSAVAAERGPGQKEAIHALGALGDPNAIPALLRAWREPDLRASALSALSALGPAAVRGIERVAAMAPREERFRAISVLGVLPDPSATRALQDALAEPELRVAVLHALGERRDPSSAASVAGWIDDPSCRSSALEALNRLADSSTVPLLVKMASVPSLRPEAIRILGRVGGADALPCLARALGYRETAGAAMNGLVTVGEPAIPILIRALSVSDLAGRARIGLTRIAHEDLGANPRAWEIWWKKRQTRPEFNPLL